MIEDHIPVNKLRDMIDAIEHLQSAGEMDRAKDVLFALADQINKSRKQINP